ncbi:MAG: acyl carrier protein [Proteobacteria bacterium]|nr:acyl carrier protein [Pseudomonadota bacterium]
MMNIENDLINFIAKAGKIPKKEIDGNMEIYNSGIVSSLVILELMTFIEKQYQIVIKPEKLVEDNFRDIKTISKFIQSLVHCPAPGMN